MLLTVDHSTLFSYSYWCPLLFMKVDKPQCHREGVVGPGPADKVGKPFQKTHLSGTFAPDS